MTTATAIALATLSGATLDRANELLSSLKLPAQPDLETACDVLLRASGCKSQPDVAALAINLTGGAMSNQDMTAIIKAAFPKDKVGDRHGSYYMSHARTGKLKGTTIVPAKSANAGKVKEEIVSRYKALEARIALLEQRIAKAQTAKSLKDAMLALQDTTPADESSG